MSNKKTLILSIFGMLTVLVLFAAIMLFILNNHEKTLKENMEMIKSNYANFSVNTTDNEKLRKQIAGYIEDFKDETFEEEQGKYVETLRKYDRNIQYIDSLIKDLEKRCDYEYEDQNTKILCKGYGGLYESTINKYVTKVKEYNDLVTKYNQNNNKSISLHNGEYESYIDYDKDGKFSGSN